MILKRLFAAKPAAETVLYEAIVAGARQPKFFAEWGVPDTVDGRFDMMALAMFLVLNRLRSEGPSAEDFRQKLTDAFFADMDRSLREMGVGDLSVGKKVRRMAEAFYGRLAAYNAALPEGEMGLSQAIARNVFANLQDGKPLELSRWAITLAARLQDTSLRDIMSGQVDFS